MAALTGEDSLVQKGRPLSQQCCALSFATHDVDNLSETIDPLESNNPIYIHSARDSALHCAGTEKQKDAEEISVSKPDMTWDIKSAPKLDFDEDYYSVLEVDSKILPKDLKKAYYSIVFVYHPDRKSEVADKDLANKQMMVINGVSHQEDFITHF